MLQKRHVAIARLKRPANLGRTSQEIHFVILVVAPTRQVLNYHPPDTDICVWYILLKMQSKFHFHFKNGK